MREAVAVRSSGARLRQVRPTRMAVKAICGQDGEGREAGLGGQGYVRYTEPGQAFAWRSRRCTYGRAGCIEPRSVAVGSAVIPRFCVGDTLVRETLGRTVLVVQVALALVGPRIAREGGHTWVRQI